MAFDTATRAKLQAFVNAARKLLTDEFQSQLQQTFGIQPTGEMLAIKDLKNINDDERGVAQKLHERIEHLVAGLVGEKHARKTAVARVIREQAFTVLNRFVAIRLAEERDIIAKSCNEGFQSKSFRVYETVAGTTIGNQYERYKTFMFCLYDELALDLGVLFDRYSPYGMLFPRQTALNTLFDLINSKDLAPIYAEDETIGWVYQYWNDPAERKKMRDESAAPRNSRELAVRNQFFTPRYVVEFLTDNTLGRIWYEMTQGETQLKEDCRYLVRRPNEIFLKPGAVAPEQPQQDNLSQEELLKQPVHIAHRPLKDPRTILLLDPACGSMHFGLYAFDLFEVIYAEAWELESTLGADAFSRDEGMLSLLQSYTDKEAFLKEVPRLIIEHNLHGIDIDPRCAQIAGLSLWLRAQKAWQKLGLKALERPAIKRSNIVCAEPMPGEKDLLQDFVAREFPKDEQVIFQHLLETIFDKMQLAGEAGSLLKIEEEITDAVEAARQGWVKVQEELPFNDALMLTGDFWENAEERLLMALRDYAEHAEGSGGFLRRLFAEDAAQGFAFIDVCRKRYDAVVMNPPFGESSRNCLEYFDFAYPNWNANLLCSSLQRGWEVTSNLGMIGAIYDRTAIIKSSYENFRRAVLVADNRLFTGADLGWGVLDANVEVTTSVLSRAHDALPCFFVDLRKVESGRKGFELLKTLQLRHTSEDWIRGISISGSKFQQYPNAIVGYDFPEFLRQAFNEKLSLISSGYSAFTGHQFKTDQHYRLWWEISALTPPPFSARLFNGAGHNPYWAPLRDIVVSQVDLDRLPRNSSTNLRNKEQHLKSGLCFGKRGEYFCAHVLPKGHYFSLEGLSIPVPDSSTILEMLGILNTPLVRESMNKFAGQHKTSGYVNLFPYRRALNGSAIQAKTKSAVLALLGAQRFDETLSFFRGFHKTETLKILADSIADSIQEGLRNTLECEEFSHNAVLLSYRVSDLERRELEEFRQRQPEPESPISDADNNNGCLWFTAHSVVSFCVGVTFGRWDIRYATGEKSEPELSDPFAQLPTCPPVMLQNEQGFPAKLNEIPASYPIAILWDGILVEDSNHQLDVARRLSEVMEIIWNKRAQAIEQETCTTLGMDSLRDYFARPSGFFADHLKRYTKSRRQAPIYWPLSTRSGLYTVWVYSHRLNDQTLHKILGDFVNPKIDETENVLGRFSKKAAKDLSTDERKENEQLKDLLEELQEFKAEITRVIDLNYQPNLNDGVEITAAPLYKLFRLPRWQARLKETWTKLEEGDYDWAHLALSMWPKRVKEKCKTDKSIAIAHDLEKLYIEPAPKAGEKKAKKSKKSVEQPTLAGFDEDH